MSNCDPQFPAELKLGCILELINDVRSGLHKPVYLARKASWLLGCALTAFDGSVPEVGVQSDSSTLELCDQLEVAIKNLHVQVSSKASLPPWLQDLILQLILRIIRDAF